MALVDVNPFDFIGKDVSGIIYSYLNLKDLLALDSASSSIKVDWHQKSRSLGLYLPKGTTVGFYGMDKWKWLCLKPILRPRGSKYKVGMSKGRYQWPDGNWFKGNQKSGCGEIRELNGSWYKGKYKNNRKHGKGEFHWSDGSWYKGRFKKGLKHGYGESNWSDGSWYKGGYKNGLKHGKGKSHWVDGSWYKGGYKKDTVTT
jgi:hypothetical protein